MDLIPVLKVSSSMTSDIDTTATLADGTDFVPKSLDEHIADPIIDISNSVHHNPIDRPNMEQLPAVVIDDGGTNADSTVPEDGGELASELEILRCLAHDLELAGLAGEQRAAQIIYLAATSRLFQSPLSVAIKGPSSGGKSYTVQRVLRFLPLEAYFSLTSASERALIYTDEDLRHRMLVLYEADAIAKGGYAAYLLRSLLSEGELRHAAVAKAGSGFATKKIIKTGPTGLIVTTTATGLDPELETRLLSLTVVDTPEQTKAVFKVLVRNDLSSGSVHVDYERWHRLQRWLATGERTVIIPFAEQLAEGVLALAVRQRRDFGALLSLIRSHALLHRASRERNKAGAIIATIQDYAVVRALIADLFAEGIEATVSPTVRQTVNAVAALEKDEVSLGELAAKLRLDKSVVSRRLRQATDFGYLKNKETRSGRPARIVLGEPMPNEVEVLPDPTELRA
jgi:hypothetical protein